jgi:hypothetical protein
MLFDDGSAAFQAAIDDLLGALKDDEMEEFRVFTLAEFDALAREQALSLDQRRDVLEQATFLIENFYCHLPFKRARYAIDPIQQFRLLQRQLDESMPAAEFHSRMLKIFASLRDVHTNYFLPDPYRRAAAFLPFQIRYFHDSKGRRRYEVAAAMAGFRHEHFKPGVEILAWGGFRVEEAIDQYSEVAAGANESARFLRGLNRLTVRTLNSSLPPREDYVLVEYSGGVGGESRAILFPWRIVSSFGSLRESFGSFGSVALGPESCRQAMLRLFYYDKPALHNPDYDAYRVEAGEAPEEDHLTPRLPDKLDFQFGAGVDRSFAVPTAHLRLAEFPDLRFGYLKIFDFKVPEAGRLLATDAYAKEFRRILELANDWAPHGLILDIRGNPGGDITLAESLLQYLTPKDIEPARFALLHTPYVQHLATLSQNGKIDLEKNTEWDDWARDLKEAPFTGSPLTRAFPLSSPAEINAVGQIYQGPVLLIIDGLTYSAADFFAAGFQDNGVGKVLGVQQSTGGGGANRWSHREIVENLISVPGFPLRSLPKNAQMGVSLRRSVRAGLRQGEQLEDLGVKADIVHHLTSADSHNFNRDLLQKACQILREEKGFRLAARLEERLADQPRLLRFKLTTHKVARVEASLTSRKRAFPQKAFRIDGDGEHEFSLEMEALPPLVTALQLRGFTEVSRGGLELCAETKISLLEPDGAARS